jgi:hypothetical protein
MTRTTSGPGSVNDDLALLPGRVIFVRPIRKPDALVPTYSIRDRRRQLGTVGLRSSQRDLAGGIRSIAIRHSYTHTVAMKNITLSVDENILATVRCYAAERNSTVNALVREYLTRIAAHQDRAKRARARLRQLSAQSRGRLGNKTWTREDLHDR